MLIGQLSKLTGFTKDTIRWYERIGLIKLDKKSRTANNYRNYDADTVSRLLLIKQIKSYGFTLSEIKEILLFKEYEMLNCTSISTILENRLKIIEDKIVELQEIHLKLVQAKQTCNGNCIESFN